MTKGRRIAAAREAKGWNQADLAEKVGVEPATVSRWETDDLSPRPRRLIKIAELTGKAIEWLQGEDERQPADDEIKARLAALEQAIVPAGPNAEIQRLRAENARMKAILEDPETEKLIRAWENAPDERNRAVFLFFLTGDARALQIGGRPFAAYARKIFQVLGLVRTKVSS